MEGGFFPCGCPLTLLECFRWLSVAVLRAIVVRTELCGLLRRARDDVLLPFVDLPDANRFSSAPAAGVTLTLDEVREADFSGVTPLGVLGWPIRHSVSPQMHNAALAELAKSDARFASWRYYRIEVPPERLKEALDLLASKGFAGLNLTVPHKVLAMQFVEVADPFTRDVIGAVNTLEIVAAGRWAGCNTDGLGLAMAIRQNWRENETPVTLAGRDVILLGAGGAARAIAAECLLGCDGVGCRSLWIGNRSQSRLVALCDDLRKWDKTGAVHPFDLSSPDFSLLPRNAIVINSTVLGLKPDDPAPMDLSRLGPATKVFDTTYGRHDSALIRQAESLGLVRSRGFHMLIWQGWGALRNVWLKSLPSDEEQDKVLLHAMASAVFHSLGMDWDTEAQKDIHHD